MSGEARPGEFLRIERIAEAVGVSQTPVREGLLALRSEGLVELLPRRGFMVTPIIAQDITDLYWVQAAISGELAARAAQRITDEQIAQLEDNVRQYRLAAGAEDWNLTQELGSEFHREVAVAAQSKRLGVLLDQVTSSLPSRYMVWGVGNPRRTVHDHPRLVTALKKRDSELARSVMTQHMVEMVGGSSSFSRSTDSGPTRTVATLSPPDPLRPLGRSSGHEALPCVRSYIVYESDAGAAMPFSLDADYASRLPAITGKLGDIAPIPVHDVITRRAVNDELQCVIHAECRSHGTSRTPSSRRRHVMVPTPPAYIDVGELDLFRDESVDYARRLIAAEVSTELHVIPGVPHGFEVFVPEADVSRRALM